MFLPRLATVVNNKISWFYNLNEIIKNENIINSVINGLSIIIIISLSLN